MYNNAIMIIKKRNENINNNNNKVSTLDSSNV